MEEKEGVEVSHYPARSVSTPATSCVFDLAEIPEALSTVTSHLYDFQIGLRAYGRMVADDETVPLFSTPRTG